VRRSSTSIATDQCTTGALNGWYFCAGETRLFSATSAHFGQLGQNKARTRCAGKGLWPSVFALLLRACVPIHAGKMILWTGFILGQLHKYRSQQSAQTVTAIKTQVVMDDGIVTWQVLADSLLNAAAIPHTATTRRKSPTSPCPSLVTHIAMHICVCEITIWV
jgi:hypothetical protein